MSTLTNSATVSATRLLGTVTTTADAVSTAVQVFGNAFDVLNVKSKDWLDDTRLKSAAMAEQREHAIIDDIAFSIGTRILERTKLLNANPDLAQAYTASLSKVTAAVQAAKVKHNIGHTPTAPATP